MEIASPSSSQLDTGMNLDSCFRLPSLARYLVVQIAKGFVLHYTRGGPDGAVSPLVQIHRGGSLALDPPGLPLDLDAVLSAAGAAPA